MENSIKGEKLARGKGCEKMLAVCYKNHWTDKNTVLVVDNLDDLYSTWTIYKRVFSK